MIFRIEILVPVERIRAEASDWERRSCELSRVREHEKNPPPF